jgi:hypothetical protein
VASNKKIYIQVSKVPRAHNQLILGVIFDSLVWCPTIKRRAIEVSKF